MVIIEFILALAAWKRRWQELALVPFIIAMGATLLTQYIDKTTAGGLSMSGYLFILHIAMIATLLIMNFCRPEKYKVRYFEKAD